ncbi:hypothetical protein C3743_39445 [Burkholderia contaminans]|uniref:Uncharacterized protein n=1 Tax=Burkholderia contaminans TaxID=488447 RepID=A0A2S5DME0_9BURK|nr:hypothetical protein WK28_24330 [Burkholderia vietnamiensis]POZ80259.1 hypothetical protein C3743_40520 [Burkholderia contaminans]POZ80290.1 hypothetical protein C3743_39445 [Burkholderia contaminans]
MGTVWEYQYEYTDLDNGEVKLYPFWLTEAEAGHCQTLLENDFGRKLKHTRRERVGPPAWREAYKVKPHGIKTLPEFDSPMHAELVELYRRERDPDVRRVILEVVRARRVMGEIEDLFRVIRNEYKDKLVAMNVLRCLIQNERWRVGEFGGASDVGAKSRADAGAREEGDRPGDEVKAK